MVAALVMTACAGPQIYHRQLSSLDKGISRTEATLRLGLPPLSTHTATSGGRTFDVHKYHLNNGVQSDIYLLAYEKGKLIYWGYVAEFRRQQDDDLASAIGTVIRDVTAGR